MKSTKLTFSHAVSLVTLGNPAQVQHLLAREPALFTPLERVYLYARLACESALRAPDLNEDEREEQWQTAAEILLAASEELRQALPGTDVYFTKAIGTIRRRRPWILWLLGNLGADLGYPSPDPFSLALRLLDERRMDIPWLRIHIFADLGRVLLRLHNPHAALVQFEGVLALLEKQPAHEATAGIYLGLCEVYKQLEEYDRAILCGKKALEICPLEQERSVLSVLGQVYLDQQNAAEAAVAYHQTLALAQKVSERLESLIALIRCALVDQDLPAARQYCTQALAEDDENAPMPLKGSLFRACGEIAQARASLSEEPSLVQHLNAESIAWYRKSLDAYKDAEVLSIITRLLLHMAEQESAVIQAVFWQEAYQTIMNVSRNTR